MIAALAVMGKSNSPLYIKSFNQPTDGDSLKFHYIIHSALDVFEERAAAAQATAQALAAAQPTNAKKPLTAAAPSQYANTYLGLLFPTEQYRVFGYVTNTNVKFVVVLNEQSTAKDGDVRAFFQRTHNLYVDAVMNPFYVNDEPITSKIFEKKIIALATAPGMWTARD